jgi:allophanate hydrolase
MHWHARTGSLDITTLRTHYTAGSLTPTQAIAAVYERLASQGEDHVWITLVPRDQAQARAEYLTGNLHLPLAGVPFAVKDNIDVVGYPTTAGCPDFAYMPEKTARVVERLEQAGAVLIGKTNLDQFATGLVGTRSPYGTPRNPFNAEYIPGGSSSGSAVAVAAGLVSFALGTDTAGSGRVPAGFNNLVGLKPTPGLLSTAGVFPACRCWTAYRSLPSLSQTPPPSWRSARAMMQMISTL